MSALPAIFAHLPFAHRGLHARAEGRIENSAAAVDAAVRAGYGIEIDLQLSADGQAMVFHDDNLDRLSEETGPVRGQSAAHLGKTALRGGRGDTISTLEQILTRVAGRAPLLIELKDQTLTLGLSDGALEAATVRALRGYSGPAAVMSFNPSMVAHLARGAPHLPRGLVTAAFTPKDWPNIPLQRCDTLRAIPDYEALGCSFISHQASDLTRPRVADLRARGAFVLTWTIRSPEDEKTARRFADNVTFEEYACALPPPSTI